MKSNRLYLIAAFAVIVLLMASGCNMFTGQTVLETPKEKGQVQTQQGPDSSAGAKVACSSDAECGKPMIGEPYCFQGNALTPQNLPKCMYPGTINSKCIVENKDKVVLCSREKEACKEGKCLVIATLPCTDTDGGKDENEAGTVMDGLGKEYEDLCMDDDRFVYERYCSHGTKGEGLTEEMWCEGRCSNGACIEEDEE